jgi:hypothetical protein
MKSGITVAPSVLIRDRGIQAVYAQGREIGYERQNQTHDGKFELYDVTLPPRAHNRTPQYRRNNVSARKSRL